MDFPSLQETKERRGATRHATRFAAYLLIGADSFAVNIQEYSATGLLLSFERDSPTPERLDSWVGMAGCIDASQAALADVLSGVDTGEPFEALEPIAARVVRTVPLGLGVHVEQFPKGWITLLEHAGRQPVTVARESNREYDQLIQRCVSVYATFSRKFASEVLARTADKLGALEGSDPFAASRYEFEGARTALAESSAVVIERFVSEGNKRVTAEPGDDDILVVPTVFSDLRLMQADELEDYLAVSAAIKRVNEQVGVALDQFELRHDRLVGVAVTAKKNPFGPEKTLRGFREACAGVKLSPQSARVLCSELEAVALAKFPPLLQDLNQMLSAVAPGARAGHGDKNTTA